MDKARDNTPSMALPDGQALERPTSRACRKAGGFGNLGELGSCLRLSRAREFSWGAEKRS